MTTAAYLLGRLEMAVELFLEGSDDSDVLRRTLEEVQREFKALTKGNA